jgi:hypothetical protein
MQLQDLRTGQRLYTLAKTATAEEMCTALQEDGVAILDNALSVFCDPDRTIQSGQGAVDDLIDLKRSLAQAQRTNEMRVDSAEENLKARMESIQQGKDPEVSLRGASVEKLQHARPDWVPEKQFVGVRRVWSEEKLEESDGVNRASFSDHHKFIRDLAAIQGLYAAVAMIPGPISASVKTVPKESLTAGTSSQAELSSSGSSLAMGIPFVSMSKESTTFRHNAEGNLETTRSTVDEKVIPRLLELKERLLGAYTSAPQTITLSAVQNAHDIVDMKVPSTGWGAILDTLGLTVPDKHLEPASRTLRGPYPRRTVGEVGGAPASVHIPTKSLG